MKWMLIFLLLCVSLGIADAQVDTLHYIAADDSTTVDMPVYDDFEPTVAVFLVVFTIALIISIIVGVGLAAMAGLIIFAFISIGIVSASIIGGLYKRSLSTAFKILIVSFSMFINALGFGIAAWILNAIGHWADMPAAILTGLAIGAAGGFMLGMAVYYTFKWLVALIKEKVGQ